MTMTPSSLPAPLKFSTTSWLIQTNKNIPLHSKQCIWKIFVFNTASKRKNTLITYRCFILSIHISTLISKTFVNCSKISHYCIIDILSIAIQCFPKPLGFVGGPSSNNNTLPSNLHKELGNSICRAIDQSCNYVCCCLNATHGVGTFFVAA